MKESHAALRINGERLWQRLMQMARVGATEKGGVCRVALSDEDRVARELFVRWCRDAGLIVQVDQMGSIFGRRAGTQPARSPVLAGSHLDSQPTGGKYDGALGVLAALEMIETLNDHGIETRAPLEIVSWTNEEGARFAPAMIASGVFAGVFDLAYGLSRVDKNGGTIGQELERIGFAGDLPASGRSYEAAFELHIEQGPILEQAETTIGIVTGVQGVRWYHLVVPGQANHAGTTPMTLRDDPVKKAMALLLRIYAHVESFLPDIRLTFGDLRPEPGVVNTVPERLTVTVDLRHPDVAVLDEIEGWLQKAVEMVGASLQKIWDSPPVAFANECVDAVAQAAASLGVPAQYMISGAGHDAVYVSRVAPTGMIFIPCAGGLSHNELEHANREDVIAGANVLLHAVLALAQAG